MSTPVNEQKFERKAIKCPVCSNDDFSVLYEPTVEENDPGKLYGAASGIRGTQTLVKCNHCEMIYENPVFPEEVIIEGYKQSDEAGHDSQYRLRVNSFLRTLKTHEANLPKKGAKVLDIGTAGGAFVMASNEFGYETTGLEPSLYLVEQCQKRGLDVKQGTIEQHELEKGSYDMVCLWDVIEHLSYPLRSLELIRPLLKEDGTLLINYPDIGTMQAKFAGQKFWWILSVHLHHFTRKTIKDICERSGFEVYKTQRYWQTLEFGYLFDVAAHLKVPLAKQIKSILPNFILRLPISYYASQTTALARIKK